MDKIKSAYEMAMERFQQRDAVSREEIDRMESVPLGKAMAATFLRESGYDLVAEIGKQPEEKRAYIIKGIQETLINNIQLPIDKIAVEMTQKSMTGLLITTENKAAVAEVYELFKNLFTYYEQMLNQTFNQMKDVFRKKIMETAKKIGNTEITEQSIEPERYSGFREEWLRARANLNDKYQGILKEQKEKLKEIINN